MGEACFSLSGRWSQSKGFVLLDDFFPCPKQALNGISCNEAAPALPGGGPGGEVITEQGPCRTGRSPGSRLLGLWSALWGPRLPLFCLHGQKEPEAEQSGILSTPPSPPQPQLPVPWLSELKRSEVK